MRIGDVGFLNMPYLVVVHASLSFGLCLLGQCVILMGTIIEAELIVRTSSLGAIYIFKVPFNDEIQNEICLQKSNPWNSLPSTAACDGLLPQHELGSYRGYHTPLNYRY